MPVIQTELFSIAERGTNPLIPLHLRDYQLSFNDKVMQAFRTYSKVLGVAPTGSGKTVMFADLAKRILPRKSLILAHRDELIDQAYNKIVRFAGIHPGVEKAERRASLEAEIIVSSIQSMANRKERFPRDHFALVIADEAHHSVSPQWQSVIEYFQSNLLGVTATPDRSDRRKLGNLFEYDDCVITLNELIDNGWLARIIIQSVPLKIDLNEVKTSHGDFQDYELGKAIEPYFEQIIKAIIEHARNRRSLIFVPTISTSQKFCEVAHDLGFDCRHIDGNSPDRKEILTRFRAFEFRGLSNAMLLTEGYDDPGIDCIVPLRPTQSRSFYTQMVGRGTRLLEGVVDGVESREERLTRIATSRKTDMLLLDFLWQHEKHNIIRPGNITATSPEIARDMQTKIEDGEQLDLMVLQGSVIAEREQKLLEELKAKKGRKQKMIDAVEFFLNVHQLDAAEYMPTMAWHEKPLLAFHISTLARLGFNPASITCVGHYAALMDVIHERRNSRMASPKQVALIRRMSLDDHPEQLTIEDATKIIGRKFAHQKSRKK